MFLKLFSYPLESIVKLRSFLFEKKIFKIYSTNKFVISVGNLSLGGTGKTPFVIFLSNLLSNRNLPNLILTRGYKRHSKNTLIVHPNSSSTFSIYEIGDEPFLVSKRTKATIVIGERKYATLPLIDKIENIKVIIIDDGFQHLRIKRDLDFVIIDEPTIKRPYIFPFGKLREPIDALHRANLIVTYEKDSIFPFLNRKNITKQIVLIKKEINHVFDIKGNEFPISNLLHHSVVLVSGLASNSQFYHAILRTGINVIEHIMFRDHYWYRKKDVVDILLKCKKRNCNQILTNEKDFYKLLLFKEMFESSETYLYSTKLDLVVLEGFDYIIEKISEIEGY